MTMGGAAPRLRPSLARRCRGHNRADGQILFEVVESGNDETITAYRLYQTVIDPTTQSATESGFAAEIGQNDTRATADAVNAAMMIGNVAGADTDDFYSFQASAGDTLLVMLDKDPGDDATITDIALEIPRHKWQCARVRQERRKRQRRLGAGGCT